MGDHFARGQRGDAAAGLELAAVSIAVEEAGGVKIAGAGQVDDAVDRPGRNLDHLVGRDDDGAQLAAGQGGKVGNDQLGGIFRHDVRAAGVQYDIAPAASSTPTARSMILVTPDAERTMNTYLGACHELTPADIDPHLIQRAKVTYMEGYLWDPPLAKEAFLKAARIAHDAGQEVALTLSDSFCVNRYLKEFQDLVMNHVDILFANIGEITALWETNDWNEAARVTQQHCDLAALTRSELGSVIVTPDEMIEIPAWPVDRVDDLTGAGDLFASGFLYGYTHGREFETCGRIAALSAGEVISHIGARPETPLAELLLSRL